MVWGDMAGHLSRDDDCSRTMLATGMASQPASEQRTRNDDDDKQDDDADDEAHAHLHVLPPHLLTHSVGTPAEALSRYRQVVGLVL